MNVADALERIDAIHSHLAKGEEYRGYRPLALAASGVVGLLAALAQPWMVDGQDPSGFVRYWLTVALGCAALAGGATVIGYVFHEDEFARRRTRTVMRQMLPCLLAGAAVTLALFRSEHFSHFAAFLPGLWSLFYGLGTVASLPYLPRLAGCVAVWHLVAGVLLLHLAAAPTPSGWCVGVPFGVGQLLAAGVLSSARRPEIEP